MFFNASQSKIGISLAVTSLTLSLSNAQSATPTSENLLGMHMTRMATISGTVSVITPTFMQAGDTISGTVVLEPKGDTKQKKQDNLKVLEGMVIDLGGTKVSPSHSLFKWTVPTGLTNLTINGQEVPITAFPPSSLPSEENFGMPGVCRLGQPLIIHGGFDGDASNTKCMVSGQPAQVLAESPRSAVVWIPATATGPQSVEVKENGSTITAKVNIIDLKLSAPKTQLLKGEKTTIGVQVTGLQGLSQDQFPLRLSVKNESPSNIQLGSGAPIERKVQAKEVSKSGEFNTSSQIVATAPGGFTVSGQLDYANYGVGSWWNDDKDHPIDMDGVDTIGDLDGYSIRRLMDTLRDLRYRLMWDYVQGKKSHKWLAQKIKLVKAALRQHGVPVEDKPIDDEDF